ncbi:CYTH and CHAD domain-containing protein [Glaciimonas immobilis]|uniref:CYTH and CHAD domain-containing protein n=1 Tax=Glaciimonas immobilis TaxID=728004 RepID=UPI001438A19F|nr:CYTH and CHAD domain-containing protein [Glaciimonas immobilis]KAF3995921.1 CYTH and CHAD domain-containing protein [Glaciimonas immobilis]
MKLLIAPGAVTAFRRHSLLKKLSLAKPYKQELVSTYFDTPDGYLMHRHAGLRVRQVEGKLIQTLKAGGRVDSGLHQRNEWESEVTQLTPDIAALRLMVEPASKWAKMLNSAAMSEPLIPLFTTRFQRSIWLLRLPEGDEVELALDQGEIVSGEVDSAGNMSGVPSTTSISEIELELKSGKAGNLFTFALALQETIALRVGNMSKAERGYRLYAPQPFMISKANACNLSDAKTINQGLRAIIENCLAQIQGNEAGLEYGADTENVHQMRIGARRLNSALAIFSEYMPASDFLRGECKWLGHQLGTARDWDVFAGPTLDAVAQVCEGIQPFIPLQKKATDFAHVGKKNAIKAIHSSRYARMLLTLGAYIHGALTEVGSGSPQSSLLKDGNESLRKFATVKLEHYQEKLRERGKGLSGLGPAERHQLRIAAKKMRYGLAFFYALYPDKKVAPYSDALSALQNTLGYLNDARVAQELLQQCADGKPDLATVSGYVSGYLAAHNKKKLQKLDKQWKKFKQVKQPF